MFAQYFQALVRLVLAVCVRTPSGRGGPSSLPSPAKTAAAPPRGARRHGSGRRSRRRAPRRRSAAHSDGVTVLVPAPPAGTETAAAHAAKHAQFIVVHVGLVHGVGVMIPAQPLEALEGFTGQTVFEFLKSPGAIPPAGCSLTDYLEPVEGFNQDEFD